MKIRETSSLTDSYICDTNNQEKNHNTSKSSEPQVTFSSALNKDVTFQPLKGSIDTIESTNSNNNKRVTTQNYAESSETSRLTRLKLWLSSFFTNSDSNLSTSAIANNPLSSTFSKDAPSIKKTSTNIDSPTSITSIEDQQQLDEFKAIIADMIAFVEGHKDTEGKPIRFETVLFDLYKDWIEHHTDKASFANKQMHILNAEKKKYSLLQHEKFKEIMARASANKWWRKFEQFSTLFGFTTTAVMVGFPPAMGTLALIGLMGSQAFVILNALDGLNNDWAKKKAASWMAGTDPVKEKKYLERIQLAAGITSGILTLVVTYNVKDVLKNMVGYKKALNAITATCKVSTSAVSLHGEFQEKREIANRLELQDHLERTERDFKKQLTEMQQISQVIHNSYEGMSIALENFHTTISFIQNH